MHNFVVEEPAGDSTGEMDQFGYFRCKETVGKHSKPNKAETGM